MIYTIQGLAGAGAGLVAVGVLGMVYPYPLSRDRWQAGRRLGWGLLLIATAKALQWSLCASP